MRLPAEMPVKLAESGAAALLEDAGAVAGRLRAAVDEAFWRPQGQSLSFWRRLTGDDFPEPPSQSQSTLLRLYTFDRSFGVEPSIYYDFVDRGSADPKLLNNAAKSIVRIGNNSGNGTGFVIDDGLAITAEHVAFPQGKVSNLELQFEDGTKGKAHVIARAPLEDLALLKFDSNRVPHMALRDSNSLFAGDLVFAGGFPLGTDQNVLSKGVFQHLQIDHPGTPNAVARIYNDIPIFEGNSGGPFFDERAKALGVLTQADLTHTNESALESMGPPTDYIHTMVRALKNEMPASGYLQMQMVPTWRNMSETSGGGAGLIKGLNRRKEALERREESSGTPHLRMLDISLLNKPQVVSA